MGCMEQILAVTPEVASGSEEVFAHSDVMASRQAGHIETVELFLSKLYSRETVLESVSSMFLVLKGRS